MSFDNNKLSKINIKETTIQTIEETISENDLNNISDNIDQFNIITVQKMIFIYNAINAGWAVRKIKDNKFEFKKPKKKIVHNFKLDKYLKDFIKNSTDNDILKSL
jgi:hypothetical protein